MIIKGHVRNKVCEMLHDEFHDAEARVTKKLNGEITEIERTIGVAQYLHCSFIHGLTEEQMHQLISERKVPGGGIAYQ
jgi:hypothetical protein